MSRSALFLITLVIACSAINSVATEAIEAAQAEVNNIEKVDFNRHIRPILSNNCFFCHGPDEAQREGDLRLDIREDAIEAFAFVPGDTEDGELLLRIFSDDPDEMMPHPDSNKELSEKDKLLLKRWIGEGAVYENHWSYNPVKRPSYKSIDQIVENQLKERGLKFSPEAKKQTLIRRVYLDLIGLPPSPEEVEAFLKDHSSKAYNKLVDRLLASKHYGEKMAIHWLDAVRYADTVGYHGDQERDATPYRDYVIASFNENKPYDKFTIEQIAGDLLPNPSIKQLTASSYNRINQVSSEGGIQDKEYIKKYQAERVRATATTWLGSTLACAECHDHKFDPFTTKDFYSMAAFFADILEKGAYTGDGAYQAEVEPYLVEGLSHTGTYGPELSVPNYLFQEDLEAVGESIRNQEAHLAKGTPEASEEFESWLDLQQLLEKQKLPKYVHLEYNSEFIGTNKTEPIDLSNYSIRIPLTAALHFDALIVGGGGRGSIGVEIGYEVEGELYKRAYHLGDNYEKELDGKSDAPWRIQLSPNLYKGVWHSIAIKRDTLNLPSKAKLVSLTPMKGNSSSFKNFRFRTLRQGSQNTDLAPEVESILSKVLKDKASRRERDRLKREFFVHHADALASEREAITSLKNELNGKRYTPLTISATPREVRVLPRGNWMDNSGELVLPASPGFLPNPITSTQDSRLNRLDLAQWIVSRENPLTARALVNRVWGMYFGTPLSSTPEDLGHQGEFPPYPELLDWLAAEFMDSGWDIKNLVKLIVSSRTYRLTSAASKELIEMDPKNRLLARQNPIRLPAEIIRDNALRISGLLNTKMGGIAARPYQPAGYYRNLNFPRREYLADENDNQYRRGVYMHWQRTFLHPMMATFDANSRDECMVKRDLSNTPLQALNLLNDPTQVEAARSLAIHLLTKATDDDSRIELAFARALARKPTTLEHNTLKKFLERERQRFETGKNQADSFLQIGLLDIDLEHSPVEVAAYTSVSRSILNLHETITRY